MTWSNLQTWDQGLNYESYGDKLTNTKKCLGNHITGRSGWSLNTTFAIKLRRRLITLPTKRYNGPRGGSEMHFKKNAVWPPRLSAIIYKRDHDKQHAAGARCTLRKMQSGPRGETPLFTNEITTSNKSRCNKAHCGRGAVSLGTLLRKLWLKEESIWLASQ